MIVKLNVSRFNTEDVIATSAIVAPVYCDAVGKLHYQSNGDSIYNAVEDQTTIPVTIWVYAGEGLGLIQQDSSPETSLKIDGQFTFMPGKFYYYDGQGYQICNPQDHGR